MSDGMLSTLAKEVDGRLTGADTRFSGVSTDTRTIADGNVFFALSGPAFDGHAFVDEAASRGAVAAVVSREISTSLPTINVEDTRSALGMHAAAWRNRFSIPVVAVTGSNGKTTVREMIAAILAEQFRVHQSEKNYNNEIGLPLTLCGLTSAHQAAVVEMGASAAGEIATLASLAQPTVSVVTNAGPAHLEGFGSLDGVARAKGELFENLGANAIAVINADDIYAPLWRQLAGRRHVATFGIVKPAEFTARSVVLHDDRTMFILSSPIGSAEISLKVPGLHNVSNALAAVAASVAAGASITDIARGLKRMEGVSGRLQLKDTSNGARLIDDTYNANPQSLKTAVDYLVSLGGEAWLVIGDMRELGEDSATLHADTGRYAKGRGVSHLLTIGELAGHASQAFGNGGEHFESIEALIARLGDATGPGSNILVKGSRGMRLERITDALSVQTAACEAD